MLKAFKLIKNSFGLIYSSTSDELKKKNAGSALGILWLFLFPILLLSVYAIIYVAIFNVRVPEFSQADYVLYIFSGLVPFLAISECLSLTTQSLISSKSLLKNTVFPVDILPVIAVFKAHVGFVFGIIPVVLLSIYRGHCSIFYFFIPVIFVLQLMFLMGIGWCLGMITVILKDTQNFIVFFSMFLMIASPIAYTPNMVPSRLSIIINFNPFAKYITSYQHILVYEQLPSLNIFLSMLVSSFLVFLIGHHVFHKLKSFIVDYV